LPDQVNPDDPIAQLLANPSESLNVEIKTWFDPLLPEGTAKIVKAAFALYNRNGGYLVIGFDNETLLATQYDIDRPFEDSFSVDLIQGIISKFAQDPFPIALEVRELGGQRHPVVVVPEGVRTPAVTKRSIRDVNTTLLGEGEIYFRTLHSNGTPSSSKLHPKDLPDLLEICFENREADIGRFLRRHLAGANLAALTELLSPQQSAGIPTLSEQAFLAIEEGDTAFLRTLDEQHPNANKSFIMGALNMRVGVAISPQKLDALTTDEFLNKFFSGNPRYTGWPAWLDTRGFRERADRPRHRQGGSEYLVLSLNEGEWSQHLDFARIDARGRLFLRRILQDDLAPKKIAPGTALDPLLLIYRVAEIIAAGNSMLLSAGWDGNASAGYAFRWTGLRSRRIYAWVNPFEFSIRPYGVASDDSVDSFVELNLDTPHSALAPYVLKAVAPLFVIFEGYQPPDRLVEDAVKRVVERKL